MPNKIKTSPLTKKCEPPSLDTEGQEHQEDPWEVQARACMYIKIEQPSKTNTHNGVIGFLGFGAALPHPELPSST